MIYKDYNICTQENEWGYFEAFYINDCDAPTIICKQLEQIIIEIDEQE